jgi:SLOG cluster2
MTRLQGLIAISVSEPSEEELGRRGLSKDHVRHAFIELCRQVLARGASVGYGGDLRSGGYSQALLALLRTYSRPDRPAQSRIRQYLAWPVRAALTNEDAEALAVFTTVVEVPPIDPPDARDSGSPARDYTAMREVMTSDLATRVVVGGRTAGQTGRWPGVVEEAYLAVRAGCPLFVAGGLGGAAACVACALSGDWPVELTTRFQSQHNRGYDALLAAGVGPDEEDLRRVLLGAEPRDGLGYEDRQALHGTTDLDHLVALILRGLVRLKV